MVWTQKSANTINGSFTEKSTQKTRKKQSIKNKKQVCVIDGLFHTPLPRMLIVRCQRVLSNNQVSLLGPPEYLINSHLCILE